MSFLREIGFVWALDGGDSIAPTGDTRVTGAGIYELSPFLPWTGLLAYPFPLLILLRFSFFSLFLITLAAYFL